MVWHMLHVDMIFIFILFAVWVISANSGESCSALATRACTRACWLENVLLMRRLPSRCVCLCFMVPTWHMLAIFTSEAHADSDRWLQSKRWTKISLFTTGRLWFFLEVSNLNVVAFPLWYLKRSFQIRFRKHCSRSQVVSNVFKSNSQHAHMSHKSNGRVWLKVKPIHWVAKHVMFQWSHFRRKTRFIWSWDINTLFWKIQFKIQSVDKNMNIAHRNCAILLDYLFSCKIVLSFHSSQ